MGGMSGIKHSPNLICLYNFFTDAILIC